MCSLKCPCPTEAASVGRVSGLVFPISAFFGTTLGSIHRFKSEKKIRSSEAGTQLHFCVFAFLRLAFLPACSDFLRFFDGLKIGQKKMKHAGIRMRMGLHKTQTTISSARGFFRVGKNKKSPAVSVFRYGF